MSFFFTIIVKSTSSNIQNAYTFFGLYFTCSLCNTHSLLCSMTLENMTRKVFLVIINLQSLVLTIKIYFLRLGKEEKREVLYQIY